MRFWFSFPRMFGGYIRPGVSFSDRELGAALRPPSIPATHRAAARKAVKALAKEYGEEVDDAVVDQLLETEVKRQRGKTSIGGFIIRFLIAVPILVIAFGAGAVAFTLFYILFQRLT
jgi:hypothetical protein